MSSPDEQPLRPVELATAARYELHCLFDDVANPTEVTVFSPEGERTMTEWITADTTLAVSLDELR
jgi:hypothetical protein